MPEQMNSDIAMVNADGIVPAGAWIGRIDPFEELGAPGLPHYGGVIQDEILRELNPWQWRKILRQMVDNDATIGAILFAMEMLVRPVEWNLKPADESPEAAKEAEFVRGAIMDDMESTWSETLSEILTMLGWGWSLMEMVFKQRRGATDDPATSSKFDDGRIGFAKWGGRAQETLDRWIFDEKGRAVAMEQSPPPMFTLRTIPLSKCLLFRTSTRKGSPEGRSLLRTAYTSWYMKTNLERIEGIGIERHLGGMPLAKIPGHLIDAKDGTPEAHARNMWRKIVTSVRRDEQEGLLVPSDRDENGHPLYEFVLMSPDAASTFDTDKIIQRYDQRIAMSVLADFVLIGHTQRSGSYGLGESKAKLFSDAMAAFLDSIAGVVNRFAIPMLFKLNNISMALMPRLTHGKVQELSLQEFAEYLKTLTGVGIVITPEDEAYIKRRGGLPVPEAKGPMNQPARRQPEAPGQELPARPQTPERPNAQAAQRRPSDAEVDRAMAWLSRVLPNDPESAPSRSKRPLAGNMVFSKAKDCYFRGDKRVEELDLNSLVCEAVGRTAAEIEQITEAAKDNGFAVTEQGVKQSIADAHRGAAILVCGGRENVPDMIWEMAERSIVGAANGIRVACMPVNGEVNWDTVRVLANSYLKDASGFFRTVRLSRPRVNV